MIFYVESDTYRNKEYRVDLLYGGGAGYCACHDHQTRRQPYIDAGGDPFDREGCCKHTRKARDYFLQPLLEQMAEKEEREP